MNRRFFLMNYEYAAFSEKNHEALKQGLKGYGRYGWKLVSVVGKMIVPACCRDDARKMI